MAERRIGGKPRREENNKMRDSVNNRKRQSHSRSGKSGVANNREDNAGTKKTTYKNPANPNANKSQVSRRKYDVTVLSPSNTLKIFECSDSILSPNIHVTSEKWDGGHTYITVTFYDYNTNQSVAVIKSSGIGMTVSHDQNIALSAIRKKINKLFK